MKRFIISSLLLMGIAVHNVVAMDPHEKKRSAEFAESAKRQKVEPQSVKIVTSDEKEIEISYEIMQQIPFIKTMVEDIQFEEAIPLSEVSESTFNNILVLIQNKPLDLDALSNDALIELANAGEFLSVFSLIRPAVALLFKRSQAQNNFNIIYSQLHHQSRLLLWQYHPAYHYFFRFNLIKDRQLNIFNKVSIHANSHYVASWNTDNGLIKLFNLNNLDEVPFTVTREGVDYITVNNDYMVVSSKKDHQIDVWDLHNLDKGSRIIERKEQQAVVTLHKNHLIAWFPSPDQGSIEIWDLHDLDRESFFMKQFNFGYYEITKNYTKLFSLLRRDGVIKIWDLKTSELLGEIQPMVAPDMLITSFQLTHNNEQLISWSEPQNVIKVWDAVTFQPVGEFFHESVDTVITTHNDELLISLSPEAGSIKVWNLRTGTFLRELESNEVTEIVTSDDDSQLIGWSDVHGVIKIWNLHDLNTLPRELRYRATDDPNNEVELVGTRLISLSDGTVTIWDINDEHEPDVFDEKFDSFQIDNDFLNLMIWSEEEGSIKIIDVNNPDQPQADLDTYEFTRACFLNDDGTRLITLGKNQLTLWKAHNLDELTADQINVMIWLYDHKNNSLNVQLRNYPDQWKVYETLPGRLQQSIIQLFPAIELEVMPEEVES